VVRRRFEQEGALDREESLKRRNQRSGFTEEPCEIPPAVRSRGDAHGLNLSSRGGAQEPSGFGSSGFAETGVLCLLKSRLAISRRIVWDAC
jgi:hypothetical protein